MMPAPPTRPRLQKPRPLPVAQLQAQQRSSGTQGQGLIAALASHIAAQHQAQAFHALGPVSQAFQPGQFAQMRAQQATAAQSPSPNRIGGF